jgi:hypothetical protein
MHSNAAGLGEGDRRFEFPPLEISLRRLFSQSA